MPDLKKSDSDLVQKLAVDFSIAWEKELMDKAKSLYTKHKRDRDAFYGVLPELVSSEAISLPSVEGGLLLLGIGEMANYEIECGLLEPFGDGKTITPSNVSCVAVEEYSRDIINDACLNNWDAEALLKARYDANEIVSEEDVYEIAEEAALETKGDESAIRAYLRNNFQRITTPTEEAIENA